MKTLATIIFALYSLCADCQTITKYYDDHGQEAPADKSAYYATCNKTGNQYQCTFHWTDNHNVRGTATYTDSTLSSPDGTLVTYDRKGHLEDSILYAEGKVDFSYHYYPNGQVAVHSHMPYGKKEAVTEFFDESGQKIKDMIVSKEAEFKGGEAAWQAYLKKNTDKDLALSGSKGGVTLTVEVEFTIDENGTVSNQKIKTSSGFKNVDKDALSVIAGSPKWSPAISYNKPIKTYRVQPVSYDILQTR